MSDPRFPNRPKHPDFWLMAGITTRNDEATEKGRKSVLDVIREAGVDPESALYLAQNRALVVSRQPAGRQITTAVAWLDGLVVGLEVARKQAEVNRLEEGLGEGGSE